MFSFFQWSNFTQIHNLSNSNNTQQSFPMRILVENIWNPDPQHNFLLWQLAGKYGCACSCSAKNKSFFTNSSPANGRRGWTRYLIDSSNNCISCFPELALSLSHSPPAHSIAIVGQKQQRAATLSLPLCAHTHTYTRTSKHMLHCCGVFFPPKNLFSFQQQQSGRFAGLRGCCFLFAHKKSIKRSLCPGYFNITTFG